MTCPSCPAGQKQTASIPPGPGVCCPTITCEPIACTIDGVDYVAGETIPTTDPCEISWWAHLHFHAACGCVPCIGAWTECVSLTPTSASVLQMEVESAV